MMIMYTDTLTSMSASIGGGFLRGLLIGYALKKVIKMLAVVVGLLLAGLTNVIVINKMTMTSSAGVGRKNNDFMVS
jgi:uncharacterized membrane protein (Fun14 family)